MRRIVILLIAAQSLAFAVYGQQADSLDIGNNSVALEIPDLSTSPYYALDKKAQSFEYRGNLERLTYELTNTYTSETDKTRAIFSWVTSHIAYDYKAYNRNKPPEFPKCNGHDDCALKYQEWENDYLERVLRSKKAVCEGYSRLFKRMCGYAGIQCSVVSGYTKTESEAIGRMGVLDHAWNIVILDGKPHYLDPTWAAGYCTKNSNGELNGFVALYNDFYWLMPQEKFRLEHFPKEKIWPFTSESDKIMFRDQAYIVPYYRQHLEIVLPETGILKVRIGEKIKFKFKIDEEFSKLQLDSNLFRNPVIDWEYDDQGTRCADSEVLAAQQYIDYTEKDGICEFEYQVTNKNLHYLEIVLDYWRAVKFKVQVLK